MSWAPKRTPKNHNSQNFKKIVKHGCGGSRDYFGEYDCDHAYDWTCDDCPLVAVAEIGKRKDA